MMIGKKTLLILALGLTLFSQVFAGGTKLTAQSVMKFLNLPVGAKAAAMGESILSASPDASLHFMNPAALVSLRKRSFFVDQNAWVAGITQISAAATFPMGSRAVLGVGLIHMDYGDIHGTEVALVGGGSGNSQEYVETGQVDISQYALSISLGVAISNDFSVGAHIKYAVSELGASHIVLSGDSSIVDNTMNALAFDFGTMYDTGFKGIKFYMFLKNFSRGQSYPSLEQSYDLPLVFNIGAGLDLMRLVGGIPEAHGLQFSINGLHPMDYAEKLSLGLEYNFKNKIFLRSGYKVNYSLENWSMGFGIRQRIGRQAITVDYAYGNTLYFDGTRRLSLSWEF
jgi:hypothetical protein